MPESNQPKKYDAVLGNTTPTPAFAVVLGGLEGIKRRLKSTSVEQRVAALPEALKYSEAGLELVIGALKDEAVQVSKSAYLLLQRRTEPQIKQILAQVNPWNFVECLWTRGGHSSWVHCVAISPDGKTIVSGSSDTAIKVWGIR